MLTGILANTCEVAESAERGVCTKTIDTAPIATPMTARSTTGARLQPDLATGWETATTTSRCREYREKQDDIEA